METKVLVRICETTQKKGRDAIPCRLSRAVTITATASATSTTAAITTTSTTTNNTGEVRGIRPPDASEQAERLRPQLAGGAGQRYEEIYKGLTAAAAAAVCTVRC